MWPINKTTVFISLLVLAGLNFVLFGYREPHNIGDAEQYIKYADNLAVGNAGSTQEKAGFLLSREPIYPILLLVTYEIFGFGNMVAVNVVQVMLVALTGYFLFSIFIKMNLVRVGLLSGLVMVILPSYTYYANLILSETLFTFILIGSLTLTVSILSKEAKWRSYVLLGFVFALLVLTRAHTLLLPLLIFVAMFLAGRQTKYVILCAITYFVFVGAWVGFIYYKTGELAITEGRQEIHLYTRAIRSQLSYGDQGHYLLSWLRRSSSGGSEDDLIKKYDAWALTRQMGGLMDSGQTLADLKSESLAIIKSNIGHYLFGNAIEWVKLMFIEHMYPPVSPYFNRLVRATMYLVAYSVFLTGVLKFYRMRFSRELLKLKKGTDTFMVISSLYILYHWLLMPFFDVIPRFNTPYLILYFAIGLAGLNSNNNQQIYAGRE